MTEVHCTRVLSNTLAELQVRQQSRFMQANHLPTKSSQPDHATVSAIENASFIDNELTSTLRARYQGQSAAVGAHHQDARSITTSAGMQKASACTFGRTSPIESSDIGSLVEPPIFAPHHIVQNAVTWSHVKTAVPAPEGTKVEEHITSYIYPRVSSASI